MYIHLSLHYTVRNEKGCSYLIHRVGILNQTTNGFETLCMPPFMGYILAHIGDAPYEQSIADISSRLGVSIQAVRHFVNQLTDNLECKNFVINDHLSINLPPALLCKSSDKVDVKIWEADDLNFETDFTLKRPEMPISVNLMATTQCTTDCIYCYADRSLHPVMETSKVLELISELHDEGVVNITLTGGDVFARKDWKTILKSMRDLEYFPYISTKTPVSPDDILFLKSLGYNEIQFSLDSHSETILKGMVNAPENYLQKVVDFLRAAGENNFKILIRSVVTKQNADINQITGFYNFLSAFDAVKEWAITPAFFSPYKADHYKNLQVNNDDLKDIYAFSKRDDLKFPILLNKISDKGYRLKSTESVEDYVVANQICMANTTALSILANGRCSLCEMLYEADEYILGDVRKSSVRDIWNSNKALGLYHLKQAAIDKDSACASCTVFEQCRNAYGKRVCYVDIRKTGKSLSCPDPRCPMAEDYNLIF